MIIDDLDDGIYYARLIIKMDGCKKELDARPSDYIALALRSDAEILVKKSVIDAAAVDKDEIKTLHCRPMTRSWKFRMPCSIRLFVPLFQILLGHRARLRHLNEWLPCPES